MLSYVTNMTHLKHITAHMCIIRALKDKINNNKEKKNDFTGNFRRTNR